MECKKLPVIIGTVYETDKRVNREINITELLLIPFPETLTKWVDSRLRISVVV